MASKKSKHLHPITQCEMYFNVLNQLCMDHQCDRRREGPLVMMWSNIVRHALKVNKQDAQLSQRDRAAGCIIGFAKSKRLELGDNILRTL